MERQDRQEEVVTVLDGCVPSPSEFWGMGMWAVGGKLLMHHGPLLKWELPGGAGHTPPIPVADVSLAPVGADCEY